MPRRRPRLPPGFLRKRAQQAFRDGIRRVQAPYLFSFSAFADQQRHQVRAAPQAQAAARLPP
ncbi:hypothetical protein CTI14_68205, partial [Methylobacterium radiotolerans]